MWVKTLFIQSLLGSERKKPSYCIQPVPKHSLPVAVGVAITQTLLNGKFTPTFHSFKRVVEGRDIGVFLNPS